MVFNLSFGTPFRFHEFDSCNFYRTFAVIPLRVHKISAKKGPHFPTYSKASKVSKAQKKPVGIRVLGISFLLSVKYVQNSSFDLFPLQHRHLRLYQDDHFQVFQELRSRAELAAQEWAKQPWCNVSRDPDVYPHLFINSHTHRVGVDFFFASSES